jgi:hypothetical protein
MTSYVSLNLTKYNLNCKIYTLNFHGHWTSNLFNKENAYIYIYIYIYFYFYFFSQKVVPCKSWMPSTILKNKIILILFVTVFEFFKNKSDLISLFIVLS